MYSLFLSLYPVRFRRISEMLTTITSENIKVSGPGSTVVGTQVGGPGTVVVVPSTPLT